MKKLLVANRGEIAIRIMRAAAELSITTVAVFSKDDANSLHTAKADEKHLLKGVGTAAYLDIEQIIGVAKEAKCDAVHPGCGFLAENGQFARRCAESGMIFVGPSVATLEAFGDKIQARKIAAAAGVPVLRGLDHPVSLEETRDFFKSLGENGALMIKAVAGGGGRGIRAVMKADEIEEAYQRCQSEAKTAFGRGDVYVEEFIPCARHIEIQVIGDMYGAITHLGERDSSIQRRFQKIIEIAPAPGLSAELRAQIIEAALSCARSVKYSNIGTFEFLVDVSDHKRDMPFAFMETNARLQVEHTVTEEVTGVDIVQAQLRLADGVSLAKLGLDSPHRTKPRGYAIQARVNMESIREDGSVHPSGGTLGVYEVPSGPGVRTDGFGYSGYQPNPAFDSLLAKVIGHSISPNFKDAALKTSRALAEFRIEGVATNIPFLQKILANQDFQAGRIHTRFVDEHIAELVAAPDRPNRHFPAPADDESVSPKNGFAGARVNSRDPLALFAHDAQVKNERVMPGKEVEPAPNLAGPDGSVGLLAPIQGTILSIDVVVGDEVQRGKKVAVVEAMKMEHIITADRSGIVRAISMAVGDVVREGYPIIFIEEAEVEAKATETDEQIDLDHIRGDLAELNQRRAYIFDENRPEAVARRRKTGQQTARENIEQLVDAGSFKEFGSLVVAAQRARRTEQWLRERSPADGLITGICSVNGKLFDEEHSRAIVVHYDYTVFAGTQGGINHYKQDRMYELAYRFRLPMILFSEGGGGRPGDTERGRGGNTGVDCVTFTEFSKLSGLVPMVGVNSGRCFGGNTALLACCDVIIATENSTIGYGGPAMIEGGSLGVYTPEEIGPMSFQVPNGAVDILVKDDAKAVETAKTYLSYFQGSLTHWEVPDQRNMRFLVPENRVRMYDMRKIIETLADKGSILEIRKNFGIGIITALVRIEGRPMGLIANNPHHLAGAIDSDGADKGARFLQLCDAFDLPIISLMDCPGIMVGPDHERTALLRHGARMFNTGANLTVPMFLIIARKCYGLGAQTMCGGSSMVPFFSVAWPTAEFAGMNIEGGVKLGYRDELAKIDNTEERIKMYEARVKAGYEHARAVNSVTAFGIDEVIDPADTRSWIVRGLKSIPLNLPRTEKKRPNIDTW